MDTRGATNRLNPAISSGNQNGFGGLLQVEAGSVLWMMPYLDDQQNEPWFRTDFGSENR